MKPKRGRARRTLVVVHGLGDQAASWARFKAAVEPRFAVLTFDLPGHGQAAPANDYRYAALVESVASATSGIDRFALLGHSVGGALAWLFAARHPERVSALVLVEPAAPHQSPFIHGPTPEPRHPFTYASVAKAIEAFKSLDPSVSEADIQRDYRLQADGRWEPAFDPAIFPPLVDDARDHGAEFRAELGAITAPTLLIKGERSLYRPGQVEEIVAEIPNARLVTMRGATHFVHRQYPEQLAAVVIEFLDERH